MATKKTEAKIEFTADVSNFQKSINNINKDITTLNNQLKLNATQLKGDSNNVDLLKERQALLTTELAKSSQKVQDTTGKLEAQKQAYGENSSVVRTTTNELLKAQNQEQAIKNELAKVNTQIENVTNSFENNSEEVADNRNAYEKLKDTITEQETELKKLKDEYSNLVIEQGNGSTEAKELKEKISNLSSELDENKKTIKNVDQAAEDAGNGGFTVFKGALADLASGAIKECLSGLKEISEEVIDVGLDFTSSMSKVQAISGASSEELAKLEETAKSLGSSTKFSASEVADGFQYMALAGWDTNDMVSAMPSILNLATAGDMDLANASDIVTDYLTAFGLTAQDSSKFVDQMAYAMSNSNTDVEQLGEAYKNCAATSTQLGYSLEDTTSALMVMANSGIKGGEAGTALSSIMTRLGNNTSNCRDILSEYGVEVYDSEGNVKSLSSILSGMKDVWANLTDEQKSNISYVVAGKSAQSELMTVLSDTEGAFESYSQGLQDCTGTAQRMSDVMSDNLQGDFTEQQSLLEGLGISIFEDFENPLRSVTSFINDNVLGPLIKLNDSSGLVSSGLSGVAVSLGILAVALGISALISGVQKAMLLLNSTLLANPIVLIVALIAGLVVAFISLWNNCESFRNFWIGLWDGIVLFFTTAKDKIVGGFNSIVNFVKGNWQGILLFIVNPFAGAFKLLYDNCEGFRNKVNDLKNKVVSIFSGIANTLKNIFKFNISLPNIKMPHFAITPKGWKIGDLMKGKIPKLSVQWYAKGGVFTRPTIFANGNSAKVVGEAGSEAILPLDVLDNKIQNSMLSIMTSNNNNVLNQKIDRMNELLEVIADKDLSFYVDSNDLAQATANASDQISGEMVELRERGLEL